MTREENPKSLRGSERMRRPNQMMAFRNFERWCNDGRWWSDFWIRAEPWCHWRFWLEPREAIVDVWALTRSLESIDPMISSEGLTWRWSNEHDVSCTDAELTEPFLIMMRLINAYEPLSTWTVMNLNDWAWLWAPQLLMLKVTLITWCWSPQTWPWGSMTAEDWSLTVSWSAWLMELMLADQDHPSEVMRWAPQWRMTAWPWTPWLSAWTLSLDQADFERRLWPSVGDTWSWDCRPFHWVLQSCDWWCSWAMSWHTCRWCWLTHNKEHDSAWTLTLILKLLTKEQMLWRSESDPWMLRCEDDQVHLTWGWVTWSRTDPLPRRTEGDLEAWPLTQLNMSLRNLLMMPMNHDEHNEPLWGRSCDRWHPEVTDEASNWGYDHLMALWHEELEEHDAEPRAWTLHH